ncbi:MAG: cytochrome c oxidase subunit 3 [Steroidobacteraceae bacterium]
MTNTAIFTALACGVVVWFLVASRLTAKSWESQDEKGDVGAIRMAPQRIGLWIFMAVVTSLFSLFISAYAMRMHAGAWCSIAIPNILWVNSLVLVGASIALQRARWSADHGKRSGARSALVVGGMLSVAFLVGQLMAWQQVGPSVYFISGSPGVAFFYVLTTVHGLHLIGGLWVLGRTVSRFAAGAELVDLRLSLQLCSVYWHFLLLVWLVVFGVLLFM